VKRLTASPAALRYLIIHQHQPCRGKFRQAPSIIGR